MGLGEGNNRGEMLIDSAKEKDLVIKNTCSKFTQDADTPRSVPETEPGNKPTTPELLQDP